MTAAQSQPHDIVLRMRHAGVRTRLRPPNPALRPAGSTPAPRSDPAAATVYALLVFGLFAAVCVALLAVLR